MSLISFAIFVWCSATIQGKIIVCSAPFYVTLHPPEIKIKMNTEGIFKGKKSIKRTVYSLPFALVMNVILSHIFSSFPVSSFVCLSFVFF